MGAVWQSIHFIRKLSCVERACLALPWTSHRYLSGRSILVLLAFFILAIQLFVTLIEFKLTTLAVFVLIPFGLFGRTALAAERVLDNHLIWRQVPCRHCRNRIDVVLPVHDRFWRQPAHNWKRNGACPWRPCPPGPWHFSAPASPTASSREARSSVPAVRLEGALPPELGLQLGRPALQAARLRARFVARAALHAERRLPVAQERRPVPKQQHQVQQAPCVRSKPVLAEGRVTRAVKEILQMLPAAPRLGPPNEAGSDHSASSLRDKPGDPIRRSRRRRWVGRPVPER
nr:type IV secretory pathway, TrbL components [Bradyrhizobium sp. DOA9]